MLRLPSVENKRIAVLGLGKSGQAAARLLAANGARVLAWDDDPDRLQQNHPLDADITDLSRCDFADITDLVLSPGIPFRYPKPHPAVNRARQAGCRVIGEAELLARSDSPARIVGVTGTNGKSTTTALITHILNANGIDAAAGGNLGEPACQLPVLPASGVYVLEMSSYQLDLIKTLAFDIAVLLNLSPDHLDRHGGMEGYVEAKRRIFHDQTASSAAIIGMDDPTGQKIHIELTALNNQFVIPISAEQPCPGGVYCRDGWLIDDLLGTSQPVCDLNRSTALRGRHNGQNAAAAFAACRVAGLTNQQIGQALNTFPGLAHRQETIATVAGVRFVNDSKATNPESTAQALSAHHDIYWIAGGQPKEGGISGLSKHLGHVRKAYLIGAAAESFAAALAGKIPVEDCGNLAAAIQRAFADARTARRSDHAAQPVVLLSPACASFDQWRDFEERGDAFRVLVHCLPEANADSPSTAKESSA